MADMMMFPDTVEEFMEQYKMVDKEQIYSNGIEYVPIFRMKQWFEHVSDTDTISRQAAIDTMCEACSDWCDEGVCKKVSAIQRLPSAEPEIIMCKDCKHMTEHYDTDGNVPYWTCSEWDSGTDYDGFCHYAEREADE